MRNLILLTTFIPLIINGKDDLPIVKITPVKPVIIQETPTKLLKVNPKELQCLATTIYGEGRGEPEIGQRGIAYTAVNRATKKDVCNVVLQPKQYSIFNNNPALRNVALTLNTEPNHASKIDKATWPKCIKVAYDVLSRKVKDPTNGSTGYLAYHSLHHIPAWTNVYTKTVELGHHTFFKLIPKDKKKKNETLVAMN